MPITDPRAVRFANEAIRPLAERVRDLKADIDAVGVAWFGGLSALFPNDSSVLDDRREAEGVSILTGADVTNLITQLLAIQTQLNGGGVAGVISKPCVRSTITG